MPIGKLGDRLSGVSLKAKVILAFSALVLMIGLFQAWYLPTVQAQRSEQALEAKARSILQLVAHDILTAYEFGDEELIQTVFEGALKDPDVVGLAIYDRGGASPAAAGEPSADLLAGGDIEEFEIRRHDGRLAVYVPLNTRSGSEGIVAGELSTAAIARQRRQDNAVSLAIAGAILAVGVGLSYLVVERSVAVPLREVEVLAERLSRGDLEVEIRRRSGDEIGRLLAAFSRMLAYLDEMSVTAGRLAEGDLTVEVAPRSQQDRFGQVFGAMVNSLRNIVEGILEFSQSVATTAEELSTSASQMARRAESQSRSTGETSAAMVEIAAQIESISRSAEELSATVEQTATTIQALGANIDSGADEAQTLQIAVDEIASTIAKMTATISSTAGKVAVVDDVSRQAATTTVEGGERLSQVIAAIQTSGGDIGKILSLIEDIADRTNLLALNAAIEAAHAGAAGRGFAVVATEVKSLAESAITSTREISAIVDKVRSDTEQAVELTDTVLSEIVGWVTRSQELVAEVSQEVRDQDLLAGRILESTQEIQRVTQQLAADAARQSRSAREVVDAVVSMSGMTQKVADATREQKRGGDLVIHTIEEIARVAQEHCVAAEEQSETTALLATEAERLHALAAVFKT